MIWISKLKMLHLRAKVLNKYGTFDQIANKNLEDPGYAYLHCDFLDTVALTTITLRVKSHHIEMHEQNLHKMHVCESGKFWH
jgi:hypothetical protein